MKSRKYLWGLLPIFILILSSCSAYANTEDVVASDQTANTAENESPIIEDTPTTEVDHQAAECEDPFGNITPAFRTDGWDTNFCKHSVSYDDIFSGGPARDGIPPLDTPRFESFRL